MMPSAFPPRPSPAWRSGRIRLRAAPQSPAPRCHTAQPWRTTSPRNRRRLAPGSGRTSSPCQSRLRSRDRRSPGLPCLRRISVVGIGWRYQLAGALRLARRNMMRMRAASAFRAAPPQEGRCWDFGASTQTSALPWGKSRAGWRPALPVPALRSRLASELASPRSPTPADLRSIRVIARLLALSRRMCRRRPRLPKPREECRYGAPLSGSRLPVNPPRSPCSSCGGRHGPRRPLSGRHSPTFLGVMRARAPALAALCLRAVPLQAMSPEVCALPPGVSSARTRPPRGRGRTRPFWCGRSTARCTRSNPM
mmetsp:Transcript_62674/g.180232  ORF Transcript_62674/g.180232 Transcript_62674/m.180232 type:complete len:309 (-) Transcript_62674:305-1231(-)